MSLLLFETFLSSIPPEIKHVLTKECLRVNRKAGMTCNFNCLANLPNSAQLEGTLYHSPSYIQLRAVVWESDEGQTHRHTYGCD